MISAVRAAPLNWKWMNLHIIFDRKKAGVGLKMGKFFLKLWQDDIMIETYHEFFSINQKG